MLSQFDLVKKYHLSIRGHLGQHLLIDPNIQRNIVNLLDLQPDDEVLEIGPGLGALTFHLLKTGASVWAIEKDKRFAQILETEIPKRISKKFHLQSQDFLEFNFKKIFARKSRKKTKLKIVSNLPYYVSAPILFRLLSVRQHLEEAVLMLQQEVAARMLATPGSKDYGRLTLAVRYASSVKHCFKVSRSCFIPKPMVNSSVIQLKFHASQNQFPEVDETFLFDVIKRAFSQRRKTLAHLFAHDAQFGKLGREKLLEKFQTIGLTKNSRAEELFLKDFVALTGLLA